MDHDTALKLNLQDRVVYRNELHIITSISCRGICAPYFRLAGPYSGDGLVSYRLCLPTQEMEQRILTILESHEARLTALERFAAEQGFACPYYEPDEEN